MRSVATHAVRWLLVGGAVGAVGVGFTRAALPSPYLLAAFVVGIGYAVLARPSLSIPHAAASAAQGVIGVTAGSYLDRTTVAAVGAHAVPIVAVSVLTVAASVASGLVLARFADVDRPTAAFGMIAGGAAGIIAISRELGADERLVAVMQYMRVLIIVAVTPVVAIGVFGLNRRAHASAAATWTMHGIVYAAVTVVAGLWAARALRLPGGSILGPMMVAAAISLVDRARVAPVPIGPTDLAFAVIGLDVGLRFTLKTLREAGEVLPRAVIVILAMLIVSAGLGVALAATTRVTMLDGYLATTPGGLTAVIALAVGSRTNTTFIVSVQVLRTLLMLAAAPAIAGALASPRSRTSSRD